MGKTGYISKWEEGKPWLKLVKGKAGKAHCSLCNKSFNIYKCGVLQVSAHWRGDSHQKLEKENLNQQKISIYKNGEIKLTGKFVLTKEENVIKAETLNVFHYVEANYSYSSVTKQSILYKEMFPDSSIAKSFTSSASKMACIVKCGLAECFKEQVPLDLERVPYTFKFY